MYGDVEAVMLPTSLFAKPCANIPAFSALPPPLPPVSAPFFLLFSPGLAWPGVASSRPDLPGK